MYVTKELHIHTLPEVNYERKKSLLYLELYTSVYKEYLLPIQKQKQGLNF